MAPASPIRDPWEVAILPPSVCDHEGCSDDAVVLRNGVYMLCEKHAEDFDRRTLPRKIVVDTVDADLTRSRALEHKLEVVDVEETVSCAFVTLTGTAAQLEAFLFEYTNEDREQTEFLMASSHPVYVARHGR